MGVTLAPRDEGKPFYGGQTDKAPGIATLLGPLGLAGGYFVVGHSMFVKAGDHLRTEVIR